MKVVFLIIGTKINLLPIINFLIFDNKIGNSFPKDESTKFTY